MIKDDHLTFFKRDLVKGQLSLEEIFQKHIIERSTFYFNDFLKDYSKEYQIKTIISYALGISIHEIYFVGSSKLGFSLKPKNLFKSFDHKYTQTHAVRDKSDIDIAIVSPILFEKISKGIYNYTDSFKNKWEYNEYNPAETLLQTSVPLCYKYFEYFSKGWFRPDFKPPGYDFCENGDYGILKRQLFDKLLRKASLGIYSNWFFFKNYHIENIEALMLRLKSEII